PCSATVARLVHAAARHGEIQVRRVARIDDDRMQLWSVGCAFLLRAHPFTVLARHRRVNGSGANRLHWVATLTIQQTPNRSSTMPKRGDQNVLASGIVTWPPSESAANTLSATSTSFNQIAKPNPLNSGLPEQ